MKIDQKSAISEELLAQLQDLGSRLARLRIARGVRQEEAALRAGISRRTVVSIENGAPSVAFGQIFRDLVSSMVLAFSNRAKVVYGA